MKLALPQSFNKSGSSHSDDGRRARARCLGWKCWNVRELRWVTTAEICRPQVEERSERVGQCSEKVLFLFYLWGICYCSGLHNTNTIINILKILSFVEKDNSGRNRISRPTRDDGFLKRRLYLLPLCPGRWSRNDFFSAALATLVSCPRGPIYIIGTCSSRLQPQRFCAGQKTFTVYEHRQISAQSQCRYWYRSIGQKRRVIG